MTIGASAAPFRYAAMVSHLILTIDRGWASNFPVRMSRASASVFGANEGSAEASGPIDARMDLAAKPSKRREREDIGRHSKTNCERRSAAEGHEYLPKCVPECLELVGDRRFRVTG